MVVSPIKHKRMEMLKLMVLHKNNPRKICRKAPHPNGPRKLYAPMESPRKNKRTSLTKNPQIPQRTWHLVYARKPILT